MRELLLLLLQVLLGGGIDGYYDPTLAVYIEFLRIYWWLVQFHGSFGAQFFRGRIRIASISHMNAPYSLSRLT